MKIKTLDEKYDKTQFFFQFNPIFELSSNQLALLDYKIVLKN